MYAKEMGNDTGNQLKTVLICLVLVLRAPSYTYVYTAVCSVNY